ncbi:hypothetical protein CYY_007138 [Polysphondylium violaceum]|uniref:THIF-type NAD/FAD binding fold domain-containing protein n=1 Tax=Polysphondylium violaceum TaxID=133409 RepID=A0A8J4PSA7_9MYCE|nr:hypothetical protein CYY_007138 [Polysphondylium violaceum]
MENKLLIAGIGAGIGAAVTYLTSSMKKRKSFGTPVKDEDHEENSKLIKMDTDDTNTKHTVKESLNLDQMLREEIFNEQMNRTMLYYGEEGFKKIRGAFVIVVGLGGVGSPAAHTLVRSGVRKIRLIDPDLVTLSSLNRNALAQRKDVGRSKVETMKAYFHDICPEVEVEAYQTFFTGDLSEKLLAGEPDYVLDCIDNTTTKVELLTYCHTNKIRVISAFGAGSSSDPTKINITDISYTFGCNFGREVRRLLKVNGITTGILCVYSTEAHRKKLIPLTEQELEILKEQEVKPTLRVRTLGVSMPIPVIFGTSMACNVLNDLAGIPTVVAEEKRTPPPLTEYTRIFKLFIKKEMAIYHTPPTHLRKMMGAVDIRYLVDDIFAGKSIVSMSTSPNMILYRWRPENPIALNNIVYLTQKEGEIHESLKSVESHYSPQDIERIDKILSQVVVTSNSGDRQ